MLVRVGLTHKEWEKIRQLALKQDVSAKKLVTDVIRDALLTNGAKP